MATDTSRVLSPRLRVTGGVGVALVAASVATAAPAQARDHVVQPGDTVSGLAVRYGTTTSAIVSANRLDRRALIRVGEMLSIPDAAAPSPAPAPPTTTTHTVRTGETVSGIAAQYGTTVAAIVAANGLDSRALILAGQDLVIPSSAAPQATPSAGSPAVTATTTTYTVRAGDTVSHLAARYGTSVSAIVAANGLDARAFIRIGQTLQVPTRSSSVTSGLVGDTFAGRTYPAATVASANRNKAALLEIGVPSKAQMQAMIVATAKKYGVDPALAQAVAFQESGFDHTSVSPANAIGTMQVIPSTGEWASELVGRHLNLLDPADNVVAGVVVLRQLTRSTGDVSTAIAGYYQGLSSVRSHGMYADTRRYVANVRTLMSRFA
ncbi:LysM peptidoglycan-binding domain-containing protein [Isoptericola sp. b441]|uniref:LysM peptidoglycan-binding domain-containing protein n=1 Tax=Actinotalea lenta TaxID=3064654 RepID=A0ABT9DAK8_9CELL|nr:LysM peptidoglycan-binding domain-containing protein [Isoptericola sp. b441]MDO8107942.1 LysM peptidoglycan-binding domain-containing protein [Isoptericola sp. b441]